MAESGSALRAWLVRLKSPEPAVREDAIKALELLGDADALAALAEVFATDAEPALRELAQWAGKSIYYGTIRQGLDMPGATEEERRQAAEILARAEVKRHQDRRNR